MRIKYRSIADMNEAILKNLYKLPHDIDLVVGIPRSGMLPANLIALYLNKPYTDIDSFIEGRIYASGERGKNIRTSTVKNVLVVDDSLCSGGALNKAKSKLKEIAAIYDYKLLYGVVYITNVNKHLVDFYCEVVDGNRIFQWNLFHHGWITEKSIFDIDGVLCPNPPIDDDGPKYIEYISNAPLLYKPSVVIDTLVSCRLEKYRSITETWLKENNIKYNNLIMLDLPNKEARLKWGKHGLYKGKIYKESNNILFIESSRKEAEDIVKLSRKPVFCIETFSMINYIEKPIYIFVRKIYWKFRGILGI